MTNHLLRKNLRNTIQLICLVFLLLANFATKAADKEPYLVKTKDFHVNDFALKHIDMGITAVIFNPYKVKVSIDEILIDVFINNKKLTTVTEAADIVKIQKESAFDLPLKIDVKSGPTIATLFKEGTKLLFSGKKVAVVLKGYVKVKALGFIPIKVKVNQTEYFGLKDLVQSQKKNP